VPDNKGGESILIAPLYPAAEQLGIIGRTRQAEQLTQQCRVRRHGEIPRWDEDNVSV
jgi:hypothetical protein